MSEFNLQELFEGIKSFDKNIMFMEKGRKFFVLEKPSEYQGKNKLVVAAQGYFKGQPNKSPTILVRAYEVPLQSNGTPDFSNAKFVCLATNVFVASKIQECFQESTMLVKRPNLLPDEQGKAFLFMLTKVDKNTEFATSTVSVQIPESLYNANAPTWSALVEEFNGMQQAMLNKYNKTETATEKKEDSTPWDN